ncbi:G-D-S-L family lipolytic protein [Tolypothrix sp. FACHB-123]|uniref:SGNH/GDSL hydrolase family protein n=1 Tax=Tolypothrix sp. FACHB-123 TaxID=2692868 RepID=UPI0016889E11|nr:SGNH/GDSL hydrolase family protein [Tolypothrix sp. FACHB-123]MBD2358249.1 G-D-S-L family lipolytic protein [Tolypothrix sp. FACHB-123]
MRDPYLLTASLLTVLAIPASALPQMSIILPEHSRFNWGLQQGSQSKINHQSIPSVNLFLPEFTHQGLQASEISQPITGEKINPQFGLALPAASNQKLATLAELSVNYTFPEANRVLVSGSQLYDQRLEALKTVQQSKRLFIDSLQPLESANKRQLTYEDWKRLLILEAKAIARSKGTNSLGILVGDSLSMWFPQEKLPAGKLWLNQGISGDTSTGILKRLSAFSETRPDVIYIMAGINDLRKGTKDEVILRNHRRIMRSLRKTHPNAQIIVQSILPTRLPTISNQRIRNLNNQLEVIAKQEKVTYENMYKWFTDLEGKLRQDLTTDGLHLSLDGYDVWRAQIENIELKSTERNN